jgi:hypothetical protein
MGWDLWHLKKELSNPAARGCTGYYARGHPFNRQTESVAPRRDTSPPSCPTAFSPKHACAEITSVSSGTIGVGDDQPEVINPKPLRGITQCHPTALYRHYPWGKELSRSHPAPTSQRRKAAQNGISRPEAEYAKLTGPPDVALEGTYTTGRSCGQVATQTTNLDLRGPEGT